MQLLGGTLLPSSTNRMTDKLPDTLRHHIEHDWYKLGIPGNVVFDPSCYLDTSYSFSFFNSRQPVAMKIGYATGNYKHSCFMTGEEGIIEIGSYTILNGINIISNELVKIGNHCMFSWGTVITDTIINPLSSAEERNALLSGLAHSSSRYIALGKPEPVIIADNVWVGFDSIIMPGVHIGEGSIIGCKTIVYKNVPSNVVFTGNPGKIVKYLK